VSRVVGLFNFQPAPGHRSADVIGVNGGPPVEIRERRIAGIKIRIGEATKKGMEQPVRSATNAVHSRPVARKIEEMINVGDRVVGG